MDQHWASAPYQSDLEGTSRCEEIALWSARQWLLDLVLVAPPRPVWNGADAGGVEAGLDTRQIA